MVVSIGMQRGLIHLFRQISGFDRVRISGRLPLTKEISMLFWYNLIYHENWFVDENGLNDGTDIMVFSVLFSLYRLIG